MNNKGQITVFLSLIISVILILGLAAHKAINVNLAREKLAINTRMIMSDIKSEYNSYIFEHYHILLFDKSFGDIGEAQKEEELGLRLSENLGEHIDVREIDIAEYINLMDDDCQAFKEQINEYMLYAAVDFSIEEILNNTNNNDGEVGNDVLQDMDDAENIEETTDESADAEQNESDTDDEEEDDAEEIVDPREFASTIKEAGILTFVLPDDMEVSDIHIDLSMVPSGGIGSDFVGVDDNFDNMDIFQEDLIDGGGWSEALVNGGSGLLYSRLVFNCAINDENNNETIFKCEREYLIAGKDSDYDNLENVVLRIIAIRLPANFLSLLGDSEKMALIDPIAAALFAATKVPASVYKYLIAGCWAYVESVADVRNLLEGRRLAFMKNSDSWITDLDSLESSIYDDSKDTQNGLSYEDYLMILLALNIDEMHMRMLDLIQLNARQEQENFLIENSAVGITVEVTGEYLGVEHSVNVSGGY